MRTAPVYPAENAVCRTKKDSNEILKKIGINIGMGLGMFVLIFVLVLFIQKM